MQNKCAEILHYLEACWCVVLDILISVFQLTMNVRKVEVEMQSFQQLSKSVKLQENMCEA